MCIFNFFSFFIYIYTYIFFLLNLAWSFWHYNALLRNLYKNIVWSRRVQENIVEPRQRSRKREAEIGRKIGMNRRTEDEIEEWRERRIT